jgi:hypothetical protein
MSVRRKLIQQQRKSKRTIEGGDQQGEENARKDTG